MVAFLEPRIPLGDLQFLLTRNGDFKVGRCAFEEIRNGDVVAGFDSLIQGGEVEADEVCARQSFGEEARLQANRQSSQLRAYKVQGVGVP